MKPETSPNHSGEFRYPTNYIFTEENTPVEIDGGGGPDWSGRIVGYEATILEVSGHKIPPDGFFLIERDDGAIVSVNKRWIRR